MLGTYESGRPEGWWNPSPILLPATQSHNVFNKWLFCSSVHEKWDHARTWEMRSCTHFPAINLFASDFFFTFKNRKHSINLQDTNDYIGPHRSPGFARILEQFNWLTSLHFCLFWVLVWGGGGLLVCLGFFCLCF